MSGVCAYFDLVCDGIRIESGLSVQQIDGQRPSLADYLPDIAAQLCSVELRTCSEPQHVMLTRHRAHVTSQSMAFDAPSDGTPQHSRHTSATAGPEVVIDSDESDVAVTVECAPVRLQALQHVTIIRVVVDRAQPTRHVKAVAAKQVPDAGKLQVTPPEQVDETVAEHNPVISDPKLVLPNLVLATTPRGSMRSRHSRSGSDGLPTVVIDPTNSAAPATASSLTPTASTGVRAGTGPAAQLSAVQGSLRALALRYGGTDSKTSVDDSGRSFAGDGMC